MERGSEAARFGTFHGQVRNPKGLAELVKDIYEPGSPNYRKYLTTGEFSGKFSYPGMSATKPFGGVIYQKPAPAGFGMFLGTEGCGAVEITP